MSAFEFRFCGHHDGVKKGDSLVNSVAPSFPPKNDFYVSVDEHGKPLSQYADNYWDYRAYGHYGFNFSTRGLSNDNKQLLKQLIFLHLYHMPLFPGKINSLKNIFFIASTLCEIADDNNITIDQIWRFPRLANDIICAITPHGQKLLISLLNKVLREEEVLGWKIADTTLIKKLSKLQIPHIPIQNAYIPPRIWMLLIQQIEEVLSAFELKQDSFTSAWESLSEAYQHNISNRYSSNSPFHRAKKQLNYQNNYPRKPRKIYVGGAEAFYSEFGISELLNKWVGYVPDEKNDLNFLTRYANLVRDSAFTYILAHSLQRVSEGLSLRSDCFYIDDDPKLGKVALLVGETTKTDPDSDARWVVPTSVEKAIKVLNHISMLRLNATESFIEEDVKKNPYLMTASKEYWSKQNRKGSIKVSEWNLDKFLRTQSNAFNMEEFEIKEEDYKIAYQLTPKLKSKHWFKVGGIWSFNAHQLRRTLAVNMFVSNVPQTVIQWLMKHKTLQQSYYYGRNHSRLQVSNEAEQVVTIEKYRSTVRNLFDIAENSIGDSVYATGKNLMRKSTLNLIKDKEHKKIEVLVKKGILAARPTLLGFCMTSSCAYGGVESAIHCAGVDGGAPCKDAVFSKKNNKRLKTLYKNNANQIRELRENSPRHSKLVNENKAIEVYFNATSKDS